MRLHATPAFLLSAQVAYGIGDFAPAQVGNTWRFEGEIRTVVPRAYGYSTSFSMRLDIRLEEKRLRGDTVVYQLQLRDSLYNRILRDFDTLSPPDTVIAMDYEVLEFTDGTLWTSGVKNPPMDLDSIDRLILRRHDYAASMIVPTLWKDSTRDGVRLEGSQFALGYLSVFVRGVGLVERKTTLGGATRSSRVAHYRLTGFWTGGSSALFQAPRKLNPAGHPDRDVGIWNIRGRDLRGRFRPVLHARPSP